MTAKPATIQARLDTFRLAWRKDSSFDREEFAATLAIPIGTASATCSYAAKLGLLSHNSGRPRKYSFPKAKAAPTADIDGLLNIVAEIDAKGVKRTTIAPLLYWAANALLSA